MAEHILSPQARRDWDMILEYIATGSIDSALRAHERFLDVFRFLGENPGAGHYRRDLTTRPLRFFPVYSYLVVYMADVEPVEIARIVSSTRDLKDILK